MKSRLTTPHSILAAAVGLALCLPTGSAGIPTAAWRTASSPAVSFLELGTTTGIGTTSPAPWSSTPASQAGPDLPTSVLPHADAQCSVLTTDPGTPPTCSATPAVGNRCSAHCDGGQRCSAFGTTAGGTAECSVYFANGRACSVLPPGLAAGSPSACSAFATVAGADTACSVMRVGRRQFCSAVDPGAQLQNFCSAISSAGGTATCSVLRGGTQNNSFCSISLRQQGAKVCSADGDNSNCSVQMGQRGTCSTFKNPGTPCSASVNGGHCSVIGGASGTHCTQP